ncbi:hypothetical protein HYC85_014090 [Camellia sinensis]|uniref:Uncharacterized protein n=1 Tax=Camellia sinensis TaxID=4442 RepID=A0A7J7H590_CAMSI|nr:hypothetical protein HYC85_014090 [Camellia sinensis]
MPMPPIPDGSEERRLRYFRESRDHLHLIEIYGPRTTQFNVYEMERDYYGWFVQYRVDIDATPNAFSEMIHSSLDPSDLHYYQFVILGLIREENDDESFLVLHIPCKVIRYNFQDKSFRELFDVPFRPDNECFSFEGSLNFSGWFDAFEFIEYLAYQIKLTKIYMYVSFDLLADYCISTLSSEQSSRSNLNI